MRHGRRLLPGASQLEIAAARPRWLTHGAIRLGVLCVFIVLVDMVSPRMTKASAGVVVLIGGALVLGGLAAFALATRGAVRRTAETSPVLAAAQGRIGSALGVLRHTGLPLLGLAFFLTWTLVYVGMWWYRPGGAFSGLDATPRFADFFYYAVSTALISPPGDIIATSRGARSATLIEMLSGLALVTAYLSSFTDFIGARVPADQEG